MKLKMYQIDAFAQKIFEGNPASVCPLDEWIEDSLMQKIANENNLSETAFFVQKDDKFYIRWFTPTVEIDLCGHATLATAYVIFEYLKYQKNEIIFDSNSGILKVRKEDSKFIMDFPIRKMELCETPTVIIEAFGKKTKECYKAINYVIVFENEQDVIDANPNLEILKKLDPNVIGVIVTSRSKKYDFVNRFFAPNAGVDEDPVTGSAFTQLIPYWSKVLNKEELLAKQISSRGGEVFCKMKDDRVEIAGYAVKYFYGQIEL